MYGKNYHTKLWYNLTQLGINDLLPGKEFSPKKHKNKKKASATAKAFNINIVFVITG